MPSLWAVTAYFNPAGYRSRRRNFRRFRAHLSVPLLAVELAADGCWELGDGDADRLLRIDGGDVMWQKERLLNLGIAALPSSCRAVAWVDCDVLFGRRDWAAAAVERLEDARLVQPFSEVYQAAPEAEPAGVSAGGDAVVGFDGASSARHAGPGIVARLVRDAGRADIFRRSGFQSAGLAWVARRELLARHGLYDACILGGGDRALVAAALGRLEEPGDAWRWSEGQRAHYRAWAEGFHAAVRGRVTHVEGTVLHLWHGRSRHRRYRERLWELSRMGFDPARDIVARDGDAWRWDGAPPELRRYAKAYFAARREDG